MLTEKTSSGRSVKDIEQLSDKRIKYFIQMLDVKEDTGMTRIYSAVQPIKNS
ncbi:MAG: hypothetical protein V4549_08805 [Bacteroidota bacterium]